MQLQQVSRWDIANRHCQNVPITKSIDKHCSVIILNMDQDEITRRCIDSVLQYGGEAVREIILINTTCGTAKDNYWTNIDSRIHYIPVKKNLGFAGGCNLGILNADNKNDIWLLNNDTVIFSGTLDALYSGFFRDDIGATGSISNHVRASQKIYPRQYTYNDIKTYYVPADRQDCTFEMRLTGFSLLIRREALLDVGLFDTRFFPGGYEDDDYCLRLLEMGWKLAVCFGSKVYHMGSITMKSVNNVHKILLETRNTFEKKLGFSEEDIFDDSSYYCYLPTIRSHDSVLEIGSRGGWISSLIIDNPEISAYAIPRTSISHKFMCSEITVVENIKTLSGLLFDYIFCSDLSQEQYSPSFFDCLSSLLTNTGRIYCRGVSEKYVDNMKQKKIPGGNLHPLDYDLIAQNSQVAGLHPITLFEIRKDVNLSEEPPIYQICIAKEAIYD